MKNSILKNKFLSLVLIMIFMVASACNNRGNVRDGEMDGRDANGDIYGTDMPHDNAGSGSEDRSDMNNIDTDTLPGTDTRGDANVPLN